MLKNIRIGARLLIVGTLIMVLPLAAVAFISLNRTSQGLTGVENEQLTARAADIALMIDSVFREEKKVAISLALDPSLSAAASVLDTGGAGADRQVAAARDRLSAFAATAELADGYRAFLAIGMDGMPFASSDPAYLGVSCADQPFFKNAVNGVVDAGSAGLDRVTNKPSVPVSAPLRSGDRIVGAFVAIANINFLQALVAGEKVGTSGYAFIVDGTGLVIAHHTRDYIFNLNISHEKGMDALARRMKGGQSGVQGYVFGGTPYSAGYAPVNSTGWSVCLTLPDKEFLAAAAEARTMILLISLGALAVAFIVYVPFARTITKPLARAVAFTELLATGDFSQRLGIDQRDEVGRLAAALTTMAGQFSAMVSGIQKSAGRVAASSDEINASAQTLAEGAQNQASTLEETSASMEELAASVDQVAGHAQAQVAAVEEGKASMELVSRSIAEVSKKLRDISGLAARSVENALQGAAAVSSVADGIGLIAGSSEKIEGILTVIGEIADQTNLLSLNAAIEAARAGEHGRGFAVVADAVGKLAERSSASTREIALLIKESGTNVAMGVQTSRTSRIAMEQIRAASQQVQEMIAGLSESMAGQVSAVGMLSKALANVNEMSNSISAATEEQTTNARQVSKAVETVNEVTQSAASAAEQMSASTEELAELARRLREMMGQFTVLEEAPAGAALVLVKPEPRDEGTHEAAEPAEEPETFRA
jgi:methyl-accepting chemotaxis protein